MILNISRDDHMLQTKKKSTIRVTVDFELEDYKILCELGKGKKAETIRKAIRVLHSIKSGECVLNTDGNKIPESIVFS